MSFPSGSVIRTPTHTLLVRPDGSIRTLREGERTWKGNELISWSSFDAFLAEKKPAWWEVNLEYPTDWFKEATEQRRAGVPDHASFGVAHAKYRADIIAPLVEKYDLKKAPDQYAYYHLYGTAGSPASKTAEQQFREVEPDPAKWMGLYRNATSEKEKKKFQDLAERVRRFGPPVPPAPPSPPAPKPVQAPLTRTQHILKVAEEKRVKHMVVLEPASERQFYVYDNDELCAEVRSLSFSTVFATIYMNNGGCSNHYMPLADFFELYTQ